MKKNFNYADEPAGLWPDLLKRLKAQGTTCVRSRIPWGAHEMVKGIRDFSKASRLRIEKFLKIAQSEGLGVELEFGFSVKKDAFPNWVWDETRLGRVPRGGWDEECSPYELLSTPTLFVEETRAAYFEFVQEALPLLNLYRAPEGPIRAIYFDAGPLGLEQGPAAWDHHEEALLSQFETIGKLNSLFQTSFRDFSAAISPAGQKTMWDRRPWLAAHSLQSLRNSTWAHLTGDLPSRKIEPPSASPQYLIDSTLIDWHSERFFPSSPLGLSSQNSRQWFTLADYLSARADAPILPLSSAHPNLPAIVFCGKYLSRESLKKLPQSQPVLFPLLTPQYDETMSSVPRVSNWISKSLEIDDSLWEKVRQIKSEVFPCP